MSKTLDYSLVFNRLSHLVALSKEDAAAEVVENLICTIFIFDPAFHLASVQDAIKAIEALYGLPVGRDLAQTGIDGLVARGGLTRSKGRYVLNPSLLAQIRERVAAFEELEMKVRAEWLSEVRSECPNLTDDAERELWECLRQYMSSVFQRHGAQTIQLLDPNSPASEDGRSLESYLYEAVQRTCMILEIETASAAIRRFFASPTPDRATYTARLLDCTFTFYAISSDEVVSLYLRSQMKPITVFIDTNFIIGILNPATNQLSVASMELVTLIRDHDIPIRLVYHEATLAELQGVINYSRNILSGQQWPQNVSRAALREINLPAIVDFYHRQNAEAPISAGVFMERFRSPRVLLRNWGFEMYRGADELVSASSSDELGQFITRFTEFANDSGRDRPDRAPRTPNALQHDMTVFQTVQNLQSDTTSFLDIGALMLTLDHLLFRFDSQLMRAIGSIGSIIMPSHLLQILRPLVPQSEEFDQRFIRVFAVPEFASSGIDFNDVTHQVMSRLAMYPDLTVETSARILADELLVEKVRQNEDNLAAIAELVDNSIEEENLGLRHISAKQATEIKNLRSNAADSEKTIRELSAEVATLTSSVQTVSTRLQDSETTLRTTATNAEAAEKDASEQRTSNIQLKGDVEKLRGEMGELKSAIETSSARSRVLSSVVTALLLIALVIFLPRWLHWNWLESHDRVLAIKVTCCLILASLSWGAWNRTRRDIVLVVIGGALSGVYGLANIL